MSFKNKMKNRGISKLDNLVETPDYIETPKPKAKFSWNWLKIAIPVTAGLVLVALPVSIFASQKFSSNKSASMNSDSKDSSESNYSPDPAFNYDDTPGTSENDNAGNSSQGGSMGGDAATSANQDFATLLAQNQVLNNYVIEVYDYADGYTNPTYTFEGEDAINIIDSLESINSDYVAYITKLDTANRNTSSYIMGINHRLIFKDGQNKMVAHYYSQFSTLVVDNSAFDLTGSDAYQIMDAHIEMDYDSTFDETIN